MKETKRIVCAALACAAGCIGIAQAGPDVIVGDLVGVSNYGSSGGIYAYAIGTTSCNVGDQPLAWLDSPTSNQYPVISQNLYRLKDGRFEQIGQAWLKHGFCSLQGTVCSPCTPGGNCDALFPGCSDPYSSSLNGSQGGLGPKHVVNPSTGFFPSSHTAASLVGTSTGNATIRARLQALQTDISDASALYFASSIYIHPQDAFMSVAGGPPSQNNQSYRRVTFASGTLNMSFTGTTQRQKPAIQAWQDNDASVVINSAVVPNDGRFLVGSKVVDLGGGQYRYEYAVQNYDSNRGASGFSVPLQSGTSTSGVYFHDVPYHSGEIQTGTDWNPTVSSGSIAWNYANDQVDDARENILRWDTVYSFSFVANAPPTLGNVSLNVFGTGSPSVVTAQAQVPGTPGGGGGAPFNNNCASAMIVGAGTVTATNVGATTDGPLACTFAGDSQINKDVWFVYTNGTCTNPMTISTCGSDFDTKLAVYAGSCPTTDNSHVACNDDTAGCQGGTAPNGLGSSVTFNPLANTVYYIRVGGYTPSGGSTTEGTITLNITPPNCAPQPPANDNCANAQWAAAGVTYTGSTALATLDGTASCGTSATTPDVWFRYQPQTTGTVVVDTCGSAYDTVLSIHTACGSASTQCNDDSNLCTGGTLQSRISMTMNAGTTYFIRVSGFNGATGNYNLLVTGGGGVVPPANDDCTNRAGFAGTTTFSTVGATTDGATTSCGQIFNDIWYNYPSGCTGTATITVTGTGGFAPSIAAYDGGTCASPIMACADAVGNTATLNIPVVQLNSYGIRIGGNTNGSVGSGTISITCTPAGPTCDSIDFNNDGLFPDTADIDDFLSVFGGGPCSNDPNCGDIDFNNDNLFPDTGDIDSLLSVFGGGPCL